MRDFRYDIPFVWLSLVSDERLLDQIFRSLLCREKYSRTLTDLVDFDRKHIQVIPVSHHLRYSLLFFNL